MIHKIIRLLYPPKCILCQRILTGEQHEFCTQCLNSMAEYPLSRQKLTHITQWSALWRYEGDVRQSILRFKFGKQISYGKVYGRFLANKLLREGVDFDILTWVPISTRRKWKRGYDQVQIITEAMSPILGVLPVKTLRKHRHTKPQSTLRYASERRANVLGSYVPVNADIFAGKKILLIDDIITTGATVSECARVLLTAGASEVHCAAVATAIKHNHRNR